MAQLRERFGAAGRAGGFAQTAREKENKANFSFIPFKKKQNQPPLALKVEKKFKSISIKNITSYIICIDFYHFK